MYKLCKPAGPCAARVTQKHLDNMEMNGYGCQSSNCPTGCLMPINNVSIKLNVNKKNHLLDFLVLIFLLVCLGNSLVLAKFLVMLFHYLLLVESLKKTLNYLMILGMFLRRKTCEVYKYMRGVINRRTLARTMIYKVNLNPPG